MEAFRKQFGRPAQHTLLYHWARLIELVNACEKSLELIDETILNKVEMSVRAHAPWISCATHCLDGGRTIDIKVYANNGQQIK